MSLDPAEHMLALASAHTDSKRGAWTYKPLDLVEGYRPNNSYFRYFGTAEVQWCLALLCQTRYPWQDMRGKPNGTMTWTTGS